MPSPAPILDYSFGLSQLGGNEALLLKLLQSFVDEYHDASSKLAAIMEEGEHIAAKQLIHTIKGVAGNLGMKALHQDAATLERAIIDNHHSDAIEQFNQSMSKTLEAIQDKIQQQGDTAPSPSQTQTSGNESATQTKIALVEALQRNEYIPPDELEEILSRLDLDNNQRAVLNEAINDLDYPSAVALLND